MAPTITACELPRSPTLPHLPTPIAAPTSAGTLTLMSGISLQAILKGDPTATKAWKDTQFTTLMRALLGVTTSPACKAYLSANYSPPSKVGAEILAITMVTYRSTAQKHPEYQIQLTSGNYLSEHSQPTTLLFLTEEVAPVIDPFGPVGWELFLTMLSSWQGSLHTLPAVALSLLQNK